MPTPFDFCLPTRATIVPHTPDWLHEVKYDGYRLRLERDGDRVRLITKGGYNWTDRYPWIVEAALKNRHRQFVIDGEAVVLGVSRSSSATIAMRVFALIVLRVFSGLAKVDATARRIQLVVCQFTVFAGGGVVRIVRVRGR